MSTSTPTHLFGSMILLPGIIRTVESTERTRERPMIDACCLLYGRSRLYCKPDAMVLTILLNRDTEPQPRINTSSPAPSSNPIRGKADSSIHLRPLLPVPSVPAAAAGFKSVHPAADTPAAAGHRMAASAAQPVHGAHVGCWFVLILLWGFLALALGGQRETRCGYEMICRVIDVVEDWMSDVKMLNVSRRCPESLCWIGVC